MRRFCLAVVIALLVGSAAYAQTTPGLFESYEEMRAELDGLLRDRRIGGLLARFAQVPEQTQRQAIASEMQIRNMLPNPLTEAEVLRVDQMQNGYRQEIMAHHDGQSGYMFTRLFLHERPDGSVLVLQFITNTEPFQVIPAP